MTRPSDETLMAYADGALAPDERERIAAEIEHDPEALALVALYRRSASAVRGAFDEPLRAPLPGSLVDMILAAPPMPDAAAPDARDGDRAAEQGRSSGDNVVVLPQRRMTLNGWSGKAAGPWRTQAAPLAAGLALVVGLATGWSLFSGRQIGSGGASDGTDVVVALGAVPATSDLARVLETRASHDAVDVRFEGQPHRAAVVATFKDGRGRYCREVDLTTSDDIGRVVGQAVACRSGPARWTIEGATRIASLPAGTTVKPASGKTQSPIEGILAGLAAAPPVSPAEEAALLSGGWQTRPAKSAE